MKRVLLKLSGEALAGEKHTGFDEATVTEVAKQVKVLVEEGVEVGVVIGGGNFWRQCFGRPEASWLPGENFFPHPGAAREWFHWGVCLPASNFPLK